MSKVIADPVRIVRVVCHGDGEDLKVYEAYSDKEIPGVQAMSWGVSIDDVVNVGTMIWIDFEHSPNADGELVEVEETVFIHSIDLRPKSDL